MKPSVPQTTRRFALVAYGLVLASWCTYASLSLVAPATNINTYQLSDIKILLLRISILLPFLVVWIVALHGAIAFKNYARLIANHKDHPGISLIAKGLFWVLAYLITASVLGAALPHLANKPVYGPVVLIRDHLPAWVSLCAFTMIYLGSARLRQIAHFTTWGKLTYIMLGIYLIFTVGFTFEFFTQTAVIDEVTKRTSAAYAPQGVLLATLILPYLAAWFLGLLASINIARYARRINGVLYREALADLARGICVVVFFTAMVQVVVFSSRFLLGLQLAPILIIVYLIIFLCALGFMFVRSGAKKLTRIEAAV